MKHSKMLIAALAAFAPASVKAGMVNPTSSIDYHTKDTNPLTTRICHDGNKCYIIVNPL